MKTLLPLFTLVVIAACNFDQNTNVEYYSIHKSMYDITYTSHNDSRSYEFQQKYSKGNDYNFYKFQEYYQSIRVDSILDKYQYNFDDSVIYNFLKKNYIERGRDQSIELLSHIGRINSENFNDTAIIVFDLNDSISLVNLPDGLGMYGSGTCCSTYQILVLRKRNNSIIYSSTYDELEPGKLLGIYADNTGIITGLLIQGYSSSQGQFYGLNSTYNVKYDITSKGIIPVEIINVRNGEPLDKNDRYIDLKALSLKSYDF